jgi:hypothetical protein
VREAIAVVVVVGLLAACALLYAGEEGEQPAAQPKLAISPTEKTWDLIDEKPDGVQIGEVCEHEFVVTNDGTAPLKLTEAKALDAFVEVTLPEAEIAPGATGAIKVVLNTVGLGPSQLASHVIVKSNDPDSARRPLVLTVKARLVPEPDALLVVSPQVYDFGVLRVGDSKTIPYRYQNAGSRVFSVRAISVIDRKRFTVVKNIDSGSLAPGVGKDFTLTFTPLPEDAGQRLDLTFPISTDSEEFPGVLCRVQGYVEKTEGVQIVPIYVGAQPPSFSFRIVNGTTRTVQVIGTRGEAEFGSVVVEASGKKEMRVVVSAEADLKEISFKIVPDYVAPEPVTPETGEVTEGATTEEGGTGETTETGPADSGTTDDSGSSTETETTGDGG